MSSSVWIGLAAGACTTLSFLPQVVRTVRTRDTQGLSLWMYLIFTSGVALWLVYGLAIGDLAVALCNGVTLLLAGVVLAYKLRLG
jgi:MtN3 and saliva related transmembrane protein